MIGTARQTCSSPSFFVFRVFPLLLVFIVIAACGGVDDEAEKDARERGAQGGEVSGERARFDSLRTEGYVVEATDLNQDEQPDQWVVKDNVRTQRIERDLNFDGQVDLWQYPDAKGQIVEEEMDLDMDGAVDVVVYYRDGVVTRKEMSIDFRGNFSIAKFYDKQGELLRVERDEDGDRDIDVWEYYEKGQRVRVGWDEDDDGQPDRFDTFD